MIYFDRKLFEKEVLMMNLGNVVIFGDSYSTFKGFVPVGNAIYYNEETGETDVRKVEETWWHLLMKETGSNLVLNDSWSGSTICHTGYNNNDCSETSSFAHRLDKYIAEGFFEKNKIDTVFIFGGTNDDWAGSPIGELQYEDFKTQDLFNILPAVCYMLDTLKKVAGNARIILLINNPFKEEIEKGMIEAANHYGVKHILFKDIDKIVGHPTIKGMAQIKEQILENLKG